MRVASTDENASPTSRPQDAGRFAQLENVSKSYGPIVALRNVTLSVAPGELVVLLGPNGAGKTTAVRLLLGLAKPNAGSARVFGGDPREPRHRTRTGAMLQVGNIPATLRVAEHIDLFSSYYPRPLPPGAAIRAAGLAGVEKRPFGKLSAGQKQRVLFALAICGDPDLLFLDEPTTGLDVEARRFVWDRIRQLIARGKAILLTTHYLHEADALADRIIVLNRGAIIAEGDPGQIKARIGGRHIRCSTRLSPAEIRAIPSVLDVRENNSRIEIQAGTAEPVVRQLLALDDRLSGLEVTSTGLEEAYLALTEADNGAAGRL